jgi:hypothetical protein
VRESNLRSSSNARTLQIALSAQVIGKVYEIDRLERPKGEGPERGEPLHA